MKTRKSENEYYKKFYKSVEQCGFNNSIVFDGFTDNVPGWFSKIGFILSTSEHEGSHQSLAEGMASGAIPISRNWDGANQLYPPEFVFSEPDEAVEMIISFKQSNKYLKTAKECQLFAKHSFDYSKIITQTIDLV